MLHVKHVSGPHLMLNLRTVSSILKISSRLWNCLPTIQSRHLCLQTNFERDIDNTYVRSFEELGVSKKLCESLAAEKIFIPTLVQHEALPVTIAKTRHCVVQSATGSGKTLTFLIPALQDEASGLTSLIIVPSRELAIQIEYQAKNLIAKGKLSKNVLTLYSGGNVPVHTKNFFQNSSPNILIGTPKKILELLDSNFSPFNCLKRIVLDEVDKLLPSESIHKKSSHEHVKPAVLVMNKLLSVQGRKRMQLIASSATVPKELKKQLLSCGWEKNFHPISTSNTQHSIIPKGITHGFIVASGQDQTTNKLEYLIDFLKLNKSVLPLVVIHRNAPITKFIFELTKSDVRAVPLHEYTTDSASYRAFLEQFKSGDSILECI